MKRLLFIIPLFACCSIALTQSKPDSVQIINNELQDLQKERQILSNKGDYHKAIEKEREIISYSKNLDKNYQFIGRGYVRNSLYNTACFYSLLSEKDSALYYLEEAVNAGYKNYYLVIEDRDLDIIRGNPRFENLLLKLRETGDYKYVLRKHDDYSTKEYDIPAFTYQSPDTEGLISLRKKYNLDSIAGSGSELSRIINLMRWVHNTIRHDGSTTNPAQKTADEIITVCKEENRGVNCRMISSVLNDVYLAMGFKSRFITCMPAQLKFDDCHVINSVFCDSLDKWIWMDASFEAYIMNEEGVPMSIEEVRQGLIDSREMKVSESLNWNGQPYGGGADRYLHQYMAKNLFRFSCISNYLSGVESQGRGITRVYTELLPSSFKEEGVEAGAVKISKTSLSIYIDNPEQFWEI